MKLLFHQKLCIAVCILTGSTILALEENAEYLIIKELTELFGSTVTKIEKRFEAMTKDNKILKTEINGIKKDLAAERKFRSEEVSQIQDKFNAVENRLIRKVKQIEHQIETMSKDQMREMDFIKEELCKIQTDVEVLVDKSTGNMGSETHITFHDPINSKDSTMPHETKRHLRKEKKRQINSYSGSKVAFFARLTSNSPKLSPNQDIVFDNVTTNLGFGYHGAHGIFIAPIPGVYVFTASILAYGKTSHHAKLVKNGQLLAKIDFNDDDSFDDSSQTVVVELDQGDDVAVQNADYTDMVFYGGFYSTFSGFLLYEYDSVSEIVGK